MTKQRTVQPNGRRRSLRDLDEAMRGLVASTEPAVVLSSLAKSCNPAFSDCCTVELSEGVEPLFQVTFPMAGEPAFPAGPGTPPVIAATLSTRFQAAAAMGHPSFAGVVVHSWAGREPTEDDAIIARLLVDRALALVHQERLAQWAARADDRAAKLALEVITSRAEGEAIGILTTKHSLARAEALRMLRRVSHTSQRDLYDVAADVIRRGDLAWPPAHRPAGPGRRTDLQIAASDGQATS
jgi:ANTAR domain